jgi:hypothetical protein
MGQQEFVITREISCFARSDDGRLASSKVRVSLARIESEANGMGERVNEVGCTGDPATAVPVTIGTEKTAPIPARELGPSETSELNVRRCLRYASVLLTNPPVRPDQRLRLLGRSRYRVRMALLGLDRLAEKLDRASEVPDTRDMALSLDATAASRR